MKSHLLQVGSIKHELLKHDTAVQTFLKDGRYEQAEPCRIEISYPDLYHFAGTQG